MKRLLPVLLVLAACNAAEPKQEAKAEVRESGCACGDNCGCNTNSKAECNCSTQCGCR